MGRYTSKAEWGIDGLLSTFTLTDSAVGAWMSIAVPSGTPIGYVAIYNVQINSQHWSSQIGSFEVWAGQYAGDVSSPLAIKCGEMIYRGKSGADWKDEMPYIIFCGTNKLRYVTMRQTGAERHLVVAEMYAYIDATQTSQSEMVGRYAQVSDADGSFSFDVPTGMYTLRVCSREGCGQPTASGVVIAPNGFNVRTDDGPLNLSVLLANASITRVVLRPAVGDNALGLTASFAYPQEAERADVDNATAVRYARCDVFQGRQSCAGATWSSGQIHASAHNSTGEVISFGDTLPDITSVYASVRLPLCHGFLLASSSSVAGGADGTVDCIGNCQTGRGYCYATYIGSAPVCAQCVLWAANSTRGEVLCKSYGVAQGGPLPGSDAWRSEGCPTHALSSVSQSECRQLASASANLQILRGDGSVSLYMPAVTRLVGNRPDMRVDLTATAHCLPYSLCATWLDARIIVPMCAGWRRADRH